MRIGWQYRHDAEIMVMSRETEIEASVTLEEKIEHLELNRGIAAERVASLARITCGLALMAVALTARAAMLSEASADRHPWTIGVSERAAASRDRDLREIAG